MNVLSTGAGPDDIATTPTPLPGGMTVWLTGLPSSGKSTIARALAVRLISGGIDYQILDGDEVRLHLSRGLGFSRDDRDENVMRIGYVASLITVHGAVCICPVVSPYRATRDAVRGLHPPDRFFEVFVSTPVDVCEGRDIKGLYAKARAGEITMMTGVDDPYEEPLQPELVLQAGVESPDESADRLYEAVISAIG